LTTEAVQTWEIKSKVRLPTTNPDDYVLKGPGKEFIVGDSLIQCFTVSSVVEFCEKAMYYNNGDIALKSQCQE